MNKAGYRAVFRFAIRLLPVRSAPLAGSQRGALEEGIVNSGCHEFSPRFRNAFLDIREDLAEATAR